MKKFDQGGERRGGFGRKSSFGAKGDFERKGGFGGARAEMHKAVCSECGQKCEVPFRPTGGKPVFCSNCFKGNTDRPEMKKFGSRDFSRPSFGEKQMFSAVCDKCGTKCEVPFRPSSDKPVYCSNCFDRGNSAPAAAPRGGDSRQLEEKLAGINAKLDEILKVLRPVAPKTEKIEKAVKPVKVEKVEKIEKPAKKEKVVAVKKVVKKVVKKTSKK